MGFSKEDDLGALWIKEGQKGKFLSGFIKVGEAKVDVVVFKNDFATAENKQPAYRVYKSAPKGPKATTGADVGF